MCFLSSGMYVSVLYLLDNPKTYLSFLSNCHSIRFSRCSERAFRMMCIRGYLPQSSLLILPTPTTHCKHFFWKCENWVGALIDRLNAGLWLGLGLGNRRRQR